MEYVELLIWLYFALMALRVPAEVLEAVYIYRRVEMDTQSFILDCSLRIYPGVLTAPLLAYWAVVTFDPRYLLYPAPAETLELEIDEMLTDEGNPDE